MTTSHGQPSVANSWLLMTFIGHLWLKGLAIDQNYMGYNLNEEAPKCLLLKGFSVYTAQDSNLEPID